MFVWTSLDKRFIVLYSVFLVDAVNLPDAVTLGGACDVGLCDLLQWAVGLQLQRWYAEYPFAVWVYSARPI